MMTIEQLATQLGQQLLKRQCKLVTAESCTGGWIAQAITTIAGSSQWFERGFVTYSNQAKEEMLGVPVNILNQYGAVSEQTARAMAEGALVHSHAQVSISVTGIAGPDGGIVEKPIGTVWFGFSGKTFNTQTIHQLFQGDRQFIRQQAVSFALSQLIKIL